MTTRSEMKENPRIDRRSLAALGALISGAGLPLTGLANHLLQTESMGGARHAWMAAHNGLGALFLCFTGWHLWLNRRALLAHLKGLSAKRPGLAREAMLAGLMVAGTLVVAVGHAWLAAAHAGHAGPLR